MATRSIPCRAVAVALLVACGACDAMVTIPGFVRPGANRPPIIIRPRLDLTSSGLLRLRATVFDPDGDAFVIQHEQRAGPFAVLKSARNIGGVFSVTLEPTGDGLHAFRIIASDGFLEAIADVSLVVGTDAAGADESESILGPAVRRFPQGRFNVRLSGQVVADFGLSAFALDGTVELRPASETSLGDNPLRVTIRTNALPFAAAAPPGALILDSAGPVTDPLDDLLVVRGNERNVVLTFGNRSGPLVDLLAVDLFGGDLVLSGPVAEDADANRFRTGESRFGTLTVGTALVRLRPDGDRISGEIFLSSRPVPLDDLPRFADYAAQLTGTRD